MWYPELLLLPSISVPSSVVVAWTTRTWRGVVAGSRGRPVPVVGWRVRPRRAVVEARMRMRWITAKN